MTLFQKRNISKARLIAIQEIKKKKKEKLIYSSTLVFAVLCTSVFLFILISSLIWTGLALYDADAGSVTELVIIEKFPTIHWHGIYGLGLRVPDFSEQLTEDFDTATITRRDLFFDCIESGVSGGNEIYASTSSTIDFDSLVPGNISALDSEISCDESRIDCPSDTFLDTMWVMVGSENITSVPSTYTYKWTSEGNIFDLGVLHDGSNFVYVTHLASLQKGYSPNVTVNFQMLLPMGNEEQLTYYFFTDPNDECPASGGIGSTLDAIFHGYAKDEDGNVLENVSVTVAGVTELTDSNGFYNISVELLEGTYTLLGIKSSYDTYYSSLNVSFANSTVEHNLTMVIANLGTNTTISPNVSGYVFDEDSAIIDGAQIYLGGQNTTSNAAGFYSITPTIAPDNQPIVSIKDGYDNFYEILNFTESTTSVNYNITMSAVVDESDQLYSYPTGPYAAPPGVAQQIQEQQKRGEDFWVSTKEIVKEVRQNTFVEDTIGIYGFKGGLNVVFSVSDNLKDFVKLEKSSVSVPVNAYGETKVIFYGTKPLGTYNGTIKLSGSINKDIPVTVKIVEKRIPIETLLMKLDLYQSSFNPGQDLKYRLALQNLLSDQGYKINLKTYLTDLNGTQIFTQVINSTEIRTSLTLLNNLFIPENISEGDYVLKVDAEYLGLFSSVSAPVRISKPIYLYSFFGIPLWIVFLVLSVISLGILGILAYKINKERKKRYKIKLDLTTLPKLGQRVVKLGKIAEAENSALYEIDRLTTHCIVAGATGMGKSISAQVIVEEALMKNIAVVVFDPTAQWSGMLRKCEDKRMIALYPKFGLKPTDAKGFPGNIRQVMDARQIINIQKYIKPGNIQVFSLNKLDPKDMDIFVANVIRQIFKSDPKESPDLKVLIVFDEVHRLLSKFGGSGEGFLQIERACREFRKWGLGLLLISQVLNDFVGEIKANINTEVQTRTIEENDLERVRLKYGEEFLKSLVRAEVGTVMFQNAEYNRGSPYFVQFRPILHNTRRLSDEELLKYNNYNDVVDDLEYQVEQLEAEKVDTFDLKMELKLVKDKMMIGNFSVVDIYLEGLKPRIVKQWEKLGKTPKKKELQLADLDEIKKSVEEAKKQREKLQKEEDKTKQEKALAAEVLEEKILPKPLTFDNGVMVSSLKELKGVLSTIDEDIFKIHVNDQKNEVVDFISQLFPDKTDALKALKTKEELYKAIEPLGKKEQKA